MSLWKRISAALAALRAGEPLSAVFDHLRVAPERTVAFTIGVIALGAKLAKADGQVTRDEVAMFRAIFTIPPGDEAQAARVFNLARQDVAGFDAYARKIAAMFPPADPVLRDLIEGLFHIAMADGALHPREEEFLREVAAIFGLTDRCFRCLRARFAGDAKPDPFDVLEVSPDAPLDEIRRVYRQAVRDTHPDRMAARGVPDEAVRMAEQRLVDINRAWEEIRQARAA